MFFYVKGLENDSEDSDAWLGLGELIHTKHLDITLSGINWPKDQNNQIASCYLKAIEFNHDNRRAWSLLGALIMVSSQDILPDRFLKVFQERWPKKASQRALFYFLQTWRILSTDTTALVNIGSFIRASQKPLSKEKIPKSYQKNWPKEWQAQAKYCLSEAIHYNQTSARAWSELATVITMTVSGFSKKQMPPAMRKQWPKTKDEQIKHCLLNAIKHDPRKEFAWINLSTLIGIGKVKIIAKDFHPEVAKLWPQNNPLYQRRFCLLMALEINPKSETAWRGLGDLIYIEEIVMPTNFSPSSMKGPWPKDGDNIDQALYCYLQALHFNPKNHLNWSSLEYLLNEEEIDLPVNKLPAPYDKQWPEEVDE